MTFVMKMLLASAMVTAGAATFCDSTISPQQLCQDGTPCDPNILNCGAGLNACRCDSKITFCDSTLPNQLCPDSSACDPAVLDCSMGNNKCRCASSGSVSTQPIKTTWAVEDLPPMNLPSSTAKPASDSGGWWWQDDASLAKELDLDAFEMMDNMQTQTDQRQKEREEAYQQQNEPEQQWEQMPRQALREKKSSKAYQQQNEPEQQWEQMPRQALREKKSSKGGTFCDATAEFPQDCPDGTPCNEEVLECPKGPRRCICPSTSSSAARDYTYPYEEEEVYGADDEDEDDVDVDEEEEGMMVMRTDTLIPKRSSSSSSSSSIASTRWWNKPSSSKTSKSSKLKALYCDSTGARGEQTCQDGTPCSADYLDCTTKGPRRCICGSTPHEYTGTVFDRAAAAPFPNMAFPSMQQGPMSDLPTFNKGGFNVVRASDDEDDEGFDLTAWLDENKLSKYEDMFRDEELDTFDTVKQVTDEQLEEMGIDKESSRDRVMRAIKKLQQAPSFTPGFNLKQWLQSLGMSEYQSDFEQARLTTVDKLQSLNDQKLKDIGIMQIGSRNRLITAARGLATNRLAPKNIPFTNLQQNLRNIRTPRLPEEWKEVADKLAHFFPSLPHETLLSSVQASKGDGQKAIELIITSTGLQPSPYTEVIDEEEWERLQTSHGSQQAQPASSQQRQPLVEPTTMQQQLNTMQQQLNRMQPPNKVQPQFSRMQQQQQPQLRMQQQRPQMQQPQITLNNNRMQQQQQPLLSRMPQTPPPIG